MTASPGLQGITPAATGWMTQQRCAAVDPDLWFQPANTVAAKAAIRICRTCPVMLECRTWALADATLEGIAGGLTEQQRGARRGDIPERCKQGHIRTDKNTRLIQRNDGTGRTGRRCLTCGHLALQRKGRAA